MNYNYPKNGISKHLQETFGSRMKKKKKDDIYCIHALICKHPPNLAKWVNYHLTTPAYFDSKILALCLKKQKADTSSTGNQLSL